MKPPPPCPKATHMEIKSTANKYLLFLNINSHQLGSGKAVMALGNGKVSEIPIKIKKKVEFPTLLLSPSLLKPKQELSLSKPNTFPRMPKEKASINQIETLN